MKKVLFFLESLKGGGAEKVLLDIVKQLPENEYQIKVLLVTDNGVYDEEIKNYCAYKSVLHTDQYKHNIVKHLFYSLKYRLVYKCPPNWIYRKYIGNEWDIVVGFVEGFATRIIACANSNSVKKVAWVHADPLEREYADSYFKSHEEQKRAYDGFDKIVCVSNSVAESFKKKWGIQDKVITQYNPIDKANIIKRACEPIEIQKMWQVQFVASGRLTAQKGFDRLIRVMKRLKQCCYDDFGLIILGQGEEKEALETQIEKENLKDSVKLLGFQRNPYPYVAKSDLLVCSSRAEGYSLVIAEAMVLGVGIISTNCSGPNELLDNGKYGLLVNNEEDALYDAMLSVLKNHEMIKKLQRQAKERSDWFDVETICREIKEQIL